jgi:ribonuclease BN (tRNA processing enzyme)
VKVTVVGCSPAWPNPGGVQSGYLVEGSARALLDCGPGVLPRLRQQEGWPQVQAIVITHFHLDHWGDLVPWTFGAMFGPGRSTPTPELWVPPDGEKELAAFGDKFGVPGMFTSGFKLREYAEDEPFQTCGLTIRPVRVPHYDLLTFALRVSDGRATLAYSGDSAPSPKLAEVARDADLFLCEATLPESREASPLRGHLSVEEAVAAFEEAGARRLVIIHRPEELPVSDGLERARDGDVYEL